jgi:hypothetical protein
MIHHIVLYKLHDVADAPELTQTLTSLTRIAGVHALQCGKNTSPLGLSGSWDFALHVQLADASALELYMADPRHLSAISAVERLTKDLIVVDIAAGQGEEGA